MTTLPPATALPTTLIDRRHTPRAQAYRGYRACLRWEFGYTCAFCFLHESDLIEDGAAGTGMTWIEHHHTRSGSPDLVNQYKNCFYSCRFCNGSRSDLPAVDTQGRRLLEPCTVVWAEHFEMRGDELGPKPEDADAAYTAFAYDLTDPRKTGSRRRRRQSLGEAQKARAALPPLVERLRAKTETDPDPTLIEAINELQATLRTAQRTIQRYAAIPADRDVACECLSSAVRTLPVFLATQCSNGAASNMPP